MAEYASDIHSVRRLAEREFLGRRSVVGVGITDRDAEGLVFLLERSSQKNQADIKTWAADHGVSVEIKVVGKIEP